MDFLAMKCLESWKKHFPDFEIIQWDESNSPLDIQYLKTAQSGRKYANMSNFMRLYALEKFGGIYFDTDVEVISSFSDLMDEEHFLCFESKNIEEHCVNNAVIGSIPNHPFLKLVKDRLLKEFDGLERANESSPVLTSQCLKELGLSFYGDQKLNGIRILPVEYFYPFHYTEEFTYSCLTPKTKAIHFYKKSWIQDDYILKSLYFEKINGIGSGAESPVYYTKGFIKSMLRIFKVKNG